MKNALTRAVLGTSRRFNVEFEKARHLRLPPGWLRLLPPSTRRRVEHGLHVAGRSEADYVGKTVLDAFCIPRVGRVTILKVGRAIARHVP